MKLQHLHGEKTYTLIYANNTVQVLLVREDDNVKQGLGKTLLSPRSS